MKKPLLNNTTIALMLAVIFWSCQSGEKTETPATASETTATSKVDLPFPMGYSASFEMGKPEYAAMILQGSWKDWETNSLDNMKNWMADTVLAIHSNNKVIKGLDSVMAAWKSYRAGYSNVIDSIDAVIPVRSTDKNEDWVLVWAREIGTKLDGSKDSADVMETWRINKDGKADFLLQYDRQTRKN